jgi:hypothetical protein
MEGRRENRARLEAVVARQPGRFEDEVIEQEDSAHQRGPRDHWVDTVGLRPQAVD